MVGPSPSTVAEARLAPIPERPALELAPSRPGARPTVVLADLHLGLGAGPGPGVGRPEELARAMALDLLALLGERSARGLLVLGDVKHPIVGTPPYLRPVVFDFFSTFLATGYEVEVVLGNHDVGLSEWLPREVRVHGPGGVVRHGVGLVHGHAWPSAKVLGAERLVLGHLHPGFRFAPTADAPAAKQRCWVRLERVPPPPPRRPRRRPPLAAREVIVLPAFNPLAGAEALNRERPARGRSFLVARFLAPGRPRAYLLDGTDLGAVLTTRPGPRPPAAKRAGKAR